MGVTVRPGLLLVIFVLTVFGLLVLRKFSPQQGCKEAELTPERQRIVEFWKHYNTATDARLQGDYETAVRHYRLALQLNPSHENSLYFLGLSLEEIGEYEQAIEVYRELTRRYPSSERAFSQLGRALMLVDPGNWPDFEAAEQAFQRQIEINREHAGGFLNLGLLRLAQRRYRQALEAFQIAANFGSPEGRFYYAHICYLLADYKTAFQYASRVLEGYWKSLETSRQGHVQEGDIVPSADRPLSAIEEAALRSMLLARWSAQKLGGYPEKFRPQLRVEEPPADSRVLTKILGSLDLPLSSCAELRTPRSNLIDLICLQGNQLRRYSAAHDGVVLDSSRQWHLGMQETLQLVSAVELETRSARKKTYLAVVGLELRNRKSVVQVYEVGSGGANASLPVERIEGQAVNSCAGDLNGDGSDELILVGRFSEHGSALKVFELAADRLQDITGRFPLTQGTATACVVADLTGDGRSDVLLTRWKKPAELFENRGETFTITSTGNGLEQIRLALDIAVHDFNSDGLPDLMFPSYAPPGEFARAVLRNNQCRQEFRARVLMNEGRGRFTQAEQVTATLPCAATAKVFRVAEDSVQRGARGRVFLLVPGVFGNDRLEPALLVGLIGAHLQVLAYLPAFDEPFTEAAVTTRQLAAESTAIVVHSQVGDQRPTSWFVQLPELHVGTSRPY